MKKNSKNPDISWLIGTPIAHRGLHDVGENGVPENSLAAYEEAAKMGFNIEIDVRLTKDGEVVVCHDENLQRVFGVDKNIPELTLDELKKITFPYLNESVPTLEETLEKVNGRIGLLIEVKNDGKVGELERKTAEILKDYEGNFAMQSFNPFTMAWFFKNTDYAHGILSTNFKGSDYGFWKKNALDKMWFNRLSKPQFISYGENALPRKKVEKSHLPVIAWTVHSDKRAKELLEKGLATNYIFEDYVPEK